jgi:hypothetical protein
VDYARWTAWRARERVKRAQEQQRRRFTSVAAPDDAAKRGAPEASAQKDGGDDGSAVDSYVPRYAWDHRTVFLEAQH